MELRVFGITFGGDFAVTRKTLSGNLPHRATIQDAIHAGGLQLCCKDEKSSGTVCNFVARMKKVWKPLATLLQWQKFLRSLLQQSCKGQRVSKNACNKIAKGSECQKMLAIKLQRAMSVRKCLQLCCKGKKNPETLCNKVAGTKKVPEPFAILLQRRK